MLTHRNNYFFGRAARLWFIFIIAGIFILLSTLIIRLEVSITRIILTSVAAIFIGLSLKLNDLGFQVDFKKHRYRHYYSIFGFKKGAWEQIPLLKKVVLTSKVISSWNTPNGISPTFNTKSIIYSIALMGEAETPELFFQTVNKKEAKQKARHLAEALNVKLESMITN